MGHPKPHNPYVATMRRVARSRPKGPQVGSWGPKVRHWAHGAPWVPIHGAPWAPMGPKGPRGPCPPEPAPRALYRAGVTVHRSR